MGIYLADRTSYGFQCHFLIFIFISMIHVQYLTLNFARFALLGLSPVCVLAGYCVRQLSSKPSY